MNWDSSRLRQYLLGDMSEEARSEFDLRLLNDREFVVAIELAEEELIDDYLDDLLTPEELKGFDQFFLKSPERTSQIEFSHQLKINAKQSWRPLVTDASKLATPSEYIASPRNRFGLFYRPTFAIPSLAVVILLLSLGYFVLRNRTVVTPSLNEIYQVNQQDLSDLSDYADLTRLTLIPQSMRDSAELRTVSLNSASELILIRLALPSRVTSQSVLVRIHNSQTIINLENTKTYANQSGRDVRVLIPRAQLTVGNVTIEITDEQSISASVAYVFAVEP
jgi:hypothetical protein